MDPYSTQLLVSNYITQWFTDFKAHGIAWAWAIGLIVLGKWVADAVQWLLAKILRRVKWDEQCRQWGITRWLTADRVNETPSGVVLGAAFWITWLCFIMQAFIRLEWGWLTWLGHAFFTYLPLVCSAAAILTAAAWLAVWLGQWFRISLEGPAALLSAVLLQAVLISLGAYYALLVLGVENGLLQPLIWILFGAVALGVVIGWVLQPEQFLRPVIRVEETEEVN
jgi:hypothetical protein